MAARTTITVQSLDSQDGETILTVAADQTNGMQFLNHGSEILLVRCPTAADVITVSIETLPDPVGRSGANPGSTVTGVSGGTEKTFGPFDPRLFNDGGGNVLVDFSGSTGSPVIAAVIVPRRT